MFDPTTLRLAALVAAQLAILLIPYVVLRRTFYSPPDPDGNLDHAIVARKARWTACWPLTVVLGALGVWWLDTSYDVVLVVYIAVVTRLVSSQARRSARSIPVLTQAFRVLAGPPLAWLAVSQVEQRLAAGPPGMGEWLLGALAALAAPPMLVAVLAALVSPVLLAAKRLRYSRLLHGRWARSAGRWRLCNIWLDFENIVVLVFTDRSVLVPPQSGEGPHFVVRLEYDRQWQPNEAHLAGGRLADYPGPGPIKAVVFGGVGIPGVRGARARLDDELVATIAEVGIGGDDFFMFITSVLPAGRRRRRAHD